MNIPAERLNEPGNIWIRPQNKQLRYSTNADESPSWLNPLPVYKASKEIKFGQPVSLTTYSQEHGISNNGSRERTAMPTNSIENESFIGIAIEYGSSDSFIHVQNNGEIVYDIKNKDNSEYWLPSYHKDANDNFVFDWTDTDVGSTVYITKDGNYTLNVDDVSGSNIMSVGKLVFAPKSTETRPNQQKIIIHIQAGGDDRGVKDTSQFTIKMVPTITPSAIESNYDRLIFVKVNQDGLGEVILNDEAITSDLESSPVGAVLIKSENGICNLSAIQNQKITLTRIGLISGNFGFNPSNVGKIGLLNNGNVAFKAATDYNVKVGIFKSYTDDSQDFLVDCRFPVESSSSGDKIGTIKPVFGPNDQPLLDVGYALVDNLIHRVSFLRNDPIDTSKIDWSELIRNCYSKDIFEFGRKVNGEYVFSRYLEDFNGKSWSPDVYDTDTTIAIFNSETFFKFRDLYYTINTDNGISQAACQIKFSSDSLNTNEECIWPEEMYKIKLKAASDNDNYVLGGKGANSTLFCNISRLIAIGNYMDKDGSNIESYDITVKVQSTGQILSPGFYQNSEGKWCGYEWYLYENNGLTYLYMSTIPVGQDAENCNGICTIKAGDKLKVSDPEETLIVTVRRRPTLYNAVYLNQYPVNNPWLPYIDGTTGNLITESAIYFGTPSRLLSQNQTDDDNGTSGLDLNESGRNGKIELTTEDSGRTINLSTQIRGSTNTPVFKDKKQVIKNDGTISNTIEWTYNFADMVTELNSYFAPILISKKSSTNDVRLQDLNYLKDGVPKTTSDFNEFLNGNGLSAIEILDTYYFRNIKYVGDSSQTKSSISILTDDDSIKNKYIFEEKENDLEGNRYSINESLVNEYKDYLYINNYINYMSLLSLIGLSNKDLYNKTLKLERIIHGADFNKNVASSVNYENDLDYINTIGLLRASGYLKNSLIMAESKGIPALDLSTSYLPNKNYFSIVDRFAIENFYNYTSLEDFNSKFEDYSDRTFNERFNLVKETSIQRGSNLAQLVITHNDLGITNYNYKIYDFFRKLNENKEYYVSNERTNEGSYIEADKIVFIKNTKGYTSVCKNVEGYKITGVKTDAIGTKDIYEVSTEDFNPEETYYINNGTRNYTATQLTEETYAKNKYYIKKTVEAKYYGYPFMWPLYEDASFKELDLEYNFFVKDTYGLDDSVSIYDDNESGILSSFSPQSLEGITFDTISKLSFLRSCFDKNHTFDSKMTWLLPFTVDDYNVDFKYEIKRLSQTRSLTAADNKMYSAFITKNNKIIELGSLYYDAYKHIFYESNFNEDIADSVDDYYNKYYDISRRGEKIDTWKTRLLKDRLNNTGLKSGNNVTIKLDLGGKDIYTYNIPDDEETYKKLIFLMTQGRLGKIRNLLENDPYKAYKLYGDFFKKDYLISIDISTPSGVERAKNSINNYIHLSLDEDEINLLTKFSITPVTTGPVTSNKQLGSYSTLISEIKSLRTVEDITFDEIQRFFDLLRRYESPADGSKDNINGNNSYTTQKRMREDIDAYDGYKTSTKIANFTTHEVIINTRHDGSTTYNICRQEGECSSVNDFTQYRVFYTSREYEIPVGSATAESIRYPYKNPAMLPNGIPNLKDTSYGSYRVEVSPTSLARSESATIQANPLAAVLCTFAWNSLDDDSSDADWEEPEYSQADIFLARCNKFLNLGYNITDILAYYYDDDNISTSTVEWDDYGLIDYARAAAYGSRNIVFYNIQAYKDFNNLPEILDLSSVDPTVSIKNGIRDTEEIVSNINNTPLKVVWPTEINTNGQMQESLTYAKNDINKYIKRTVSDESGLGDFGIINIKTNPVSRISIKDVDNLPDITVNELKLLLNGDRNIGDRCGLNADEIKEYNLNLDELTIAISSTQVPVVDLTDTVYKTLYELRTLQYEQIEAHNNDNPENTEEVLSTAVCSIPKVSLIYDLIDQGLVFDDAEFFARSILAEGENIAGGFTRNPELETTYGLLNEEYFGHLETSNGHFYGNRLEGLSIHNSTQTEKNIGDFKLKEVYDYNNIDRVILALDPARYEVLLKNISTIKNYIELFFDHSDKILKDFSVLTKSGTIALKGTTYIDDMLDKDKVKNALQAVKDSINTTISKTIANGASNAAQDTFSAKFTSLINQLITASLNIEGTVYAQTLEGPNATGQYDIVTKDCPINFSQKSISFPNLSTYITQFENELKNTIVSYVKDIINNSTFKVTKGSTNFSNLTIDEPKGYNLEKYDPSKDREDSTGFQEEQYIYKEPIPEYSYLYTKPADGISVKKEVNSYNINEGSYHNEVVTTISHKRLIGEPIQKEAFIGDRVEVKEGAYLRGEQLPLPLVSLDIRPDIQMQSQRLSYKPTFNDYYNGFKDHTDYGSATMKSVSISGAFPLIEVNGKRFTINSVKKYIIDGNEFTVLPNGLKIIPTFDLTVNIKGQNPQYYDEEAQVLVDGDLVNENYVFAFEGSKIYRNSIYSMTLSPVEGQDVELPIIFKANKINTTTNSSIVVNYNIDEDNIIHSFEGSVEDTGKTRKITADRELIRDIILNSDIFVANVILDSSRKIVENVGQTTNPYGDAKTKVENYNVKHISEVNFNLIY